VSHRYLFTEPKDNDGDDDDGTHAPNPALRRYGIRNRKRKKSMGAFASFRKSDSLLLSSMSYSMSGARARVVRLGQSIATEQ
jgi:hypothetical protein